MRHALNSRRRGRSMTWLWPAATRCGGVRRSRRCGRAPSRADRPRRAGGRAAEANVRQAQALASAAAANTQQAEAAARAARVRAARAQLRAPFDGTVTRIYLNPGAPAAPGIPVLALVTDDGWVIADVDEADIRLVP